MANLNNYNILDENRDYFFKALNNFKSFQPYFTPEDSATFFAGADDEYTQGTVSDDRGQIEFTGRYFLGSSNNLGPTNYSARITSEKYTYRLYATQTMAQVNEIHNTCIVRVPRKFVIHMNPETLAEETDNTIFDFFVIKNNQGAFPFTGTMTRHDQSVVYFKFDSNHSGWYESNRVVQKIGETSISTYQMSFSTLNYHTQFAWEDYPATAQQAFDTLIERMSGSVAYTFNTTSSFSPKGKSDEFDNRYIGIKYSDYPIFDIKDTEKILNWFSTGDRTGEIEPGEDPDDPYIGPDSPATDFDWTNKGIFVRAFAGGSKGFGDGSLKWDLQLFNPQLDNSPRGRELIAFNIMTAKVEEGEATKWIPDKVIDTFKYTKATKTLDIRKAFDIGDEPTLEQFNNTQGLIFQMIDGRSYRNTSTSMLVLFKFDSSKLSGTQIQSVYFKEPNSDIPYFNVDIAVKNSISVEYQGEEFQAEDYTTQNDWSVGINASELVFIFTNVLPVDDPDIPDIPPYDPPAPNVWNTEGIGTFKVNAATLQEVEKKLFSGDITSQFTQNMINCIVTAKMIPYGGRSKSSGRTRMYIGNAYIDNDASSTQVNEVVRYETYTAIENYEIPSIYSEEPYDLDFLDYEPYTSMKLYLPFTTSGWYDLPVHLFRMNKLTIKYCVDFVTGDIKYFIYSGTTPIIKATGNCSIDIPFNTNHNAERIMAQVNGAVKLLGNTVGIVASAYTGNVAGAVGGAIGAVGNVAELWIPKWSYESTGISSQVDTAFEVNHIMLLVEYPDILTDATTERFKHINGKPFMKSRELRFMHGYTEVSNINLDGLVCTQAEKDEIIRTLIGGVYLP